MHAEFVARLERYSARTTLVRGSWDARESSAVAAVEKLLSHG
jgi:nicotinamide riboside kinase